MRRFRRKILDAFLTVALCRRRRRAVHVMPARPRKQAVFGARTSSVCIGGMMCGSSRMTSTRCSRRRSCRLLPPSSFIMKRWMMGGTISSIGTSIRSGQTQRTAPAQVTLTELIDPTKHCSLHVSLPASEADAERIAHRGGMAGVTVIPSSTVIVDTGFSSTHRGLGNPICSDLFHAPTTLHCIHGQNCKEATMLRS
jgi:hypothetical protein